MLLLCNNSNVSGKAGDWKTIDLSAMDHQAQTKLLRQSRALLASDSYRPLYHFSPPDCGLHDAAGLCWWRTKYHLFYLYETATVRWGRGHAVSDETVVQRLLRRARHQLEGHAAAKAKESDLKKCLKQCQ